VILDARPDALALQEVVSEEAVVALEGRLAARGRRYAHALSRCGGKRSLRVGFLYDPRAVTLASVREFPALEPGGEGQCAGDDRSGLVAELLHRGRRVHALTAHLAAGAEPERVARRRQQWGRLLAIARQLRAEGATRVVALGDMNSTGWLDDAGGERALITDGARGAGLAVATAAVACTEYWRGPRGRFEPSVLDHVLASPETRASAAAVHGYCARLACAPHPLDQPTAEYAVVSDHCPVTVDIP
jgi:endonuclease/exonuclease/phosphatase family metal-dependent hydrolase